MSSHADYICYSLNSANLVLIEYARLKIGSTSLDPHGSVYLLQFNSPANLVLIEDAR